MKLSELVNFYNRLCDLDSEHIKTFLTLELSKITDLANQDNLFYSQHTLISQFDKFVEQFEHFKKTIWDQIRELEKPYFQQSYRDYDIVNQHKYLWFDMDVSKMPAHLQADQQQNKNSNVKTHIESILNKKLDISPYAMDFLSARILRYSGWQMTTMVVRPVTFPWLDKMVSNDPLYLVDENHELIAPAVSNWNELYQRRLQPYVIHELQNNEILWQLPDNQFGLVLIWNYFDHRPFEIIKQYLIEIYQKLRPGGVLCMSFNDCDRWQGVLAVESRSGLYTPGFLIKSFAQSLGFDIHFEWNEQGSWTWLELKKPGNFDSLRGGQTLARILPKPVAESK